MIDQKMEGLGLKQKISAKPCYIFFWSEEGLTYYHKLAPESVLFWEPQVENRKQYLYYELALKHPVRGKMGIPVAAMMTGDQSLPCVQDWITRFRHAEKKYSVMGMSQNRICL